MSNTDDIAGKVVLLTGASSGIGAHLAKVLVGCKARIAAVARRIDMLEKIAKEVSALAGTLTPVQIDLMSIESIRKGIAAIEAALGPVEILINNAGILHQSKATEVTESDFDRLFATNVKGTFFVTQICGKRMIDLGISGKIVNTASVAGLVAMPQLAIYGMTKAAIVYMTKALAKEWARHDISVNAICPGYFSTDMNRLFFESPAGQKLIEKLPKRRLATPEGIEDLFLLLISARQSRFMNGSIITVDDGYSVS
jgi:NAD(P)-dependent dehydrogenase (short-subunit alcohol dehydrogenase family)